MADSFFSTLKLKVDLDDDREVLISPQQLQPDMAFWIERYNRRGHSHSMINYFSPIGYEQPFITALTTFCTNP
ncbi:hypothetical protein [Synechococcus sp. CS-1332]|uniref:hypothetical protein n=1 Tax=Synechococcus sp. CS-1332 TaxID=2847972 RepID=UPI00223BAC3C|nr:hypothetical protein [Synechococcus sp. CS-1332]MCT0208308.1 hypothetical protein [Synechococcus sp. CS-1332]